MNNFISKFKIITILLIVLLLLNMWYNSSLNKLDPINVLFLCFSSLGITISVYCYVLLKLTPTGEIKSKHFEFTLTIVSAILVFSTFLSLLILILHFTPPIF